MNCLDTIRELDETDPDFVIEVLIPPEEIDTIEASIRDSIFTRTEIADHYIDNAEYKGVKVSQRARDALIEGLHWYGESTETR